MKILVPLDGSQVAEEVLAHVAAFARDFAVEILLLQVLASNRSEPDDPFDDFDWQLRCTRSHSYLQSVAARIGDAAQLEIRCRIAEGEPAQQIVDCCRQEQIDLLMLCSYGAGSGGLRRFDRGGTLQKVLSQVDTSLLLVNPDGGSTGDGACYRRILVPLEDSSRSEWSLSLASAIARAHGAELALLQVLQQPRVTLRVQESAEGRQLIDRLMELNRQDAVRHLEDLKARVSQGLRVQTQVTCAGNIADAIERAATSQQADLIILSAHGRDTHGGRSFGPVAEPLLAHSRLPLLILQDAGRSMRLNPRPRPPVRTTPQEVRRRAEAE